MASVRVDRSSYNTWLEVGRADSLADGVIYFLRPEGPKARERYSETVRIASA